jgi:hypothetical protein
MSGYDPDQHHPLVSYGALTAIFGTALGGSLLAARARGRELPERVAPGDVVLAALATQTLSRLLAKDRVTSFLRAPFTRFEDDAGQGEVEEAARGRGARRALGELLICPYCVSQWIAGGFAVGYVAAPRLTRLLTALWTTQALADFAQLGYTAAEEHA